MRVTTPFISAGCNRHPAAADWRGPPPPTTTTTSPSSQSPPQSTGGDGDGLLAYATRRGIALWNPADPARRGIRRILKGHEEGVNVVRWARQVQVDVLLSGGVDGILGVWEEEEGWGYVLVQKVEVGGSVNDVAVLSGKGKGIHVAVASADGGVSVHEISTRLVQKITTKPKFFPLSIAIAALPSNGGTVLAIAGSMTSIQIWVSSGNGEEEGQEGEGKGGFTLRATLTGHENWVRAMAFTNEVPGDADSDLLLASASQDKYIRLWRFHRGKELPKQGGTTAGDSKFGAIGRSGLSNKAHRFTSREEEYSVTFEALLMGHEDWVYTVRWKPVSAGAEGGKEQLQLLSASADNSVSIWTQDVESGIWLSTTRLGEISDQKGSSTATGSSGGLWIGLWSPTGEQVAALGRTGSWRLWSHPPEGDRWVQEVATGGHVRDATGISWSVGGEYLLSTSLDQTTRLMAKWTKESGGGGWWHEFSRPQIHGYDINCIVALGPAEGEGENARGGARFVSGADEKLLRVFEEPKGVAGLLDRLAGIGGGSGVDSMPEGADQPVLGLSNKATTAAEETLAEITEAIAEETEEAAPPPPAAATHILNTLSHPPLEDHLSRHTLWPEVDKLYGHGHEISCVASTHSGRYIATACRASSTDHAAIRIYDTQTWREVKPPIVGGHTLTVLSMAFSYDDQYLLSVSRDRSWVVYKSTKEAGEDGTYTELCRQTKGTGQFKTGHTRVIFDCSWAPMNPANPSALKRFATAGRDKSVRIWTQDTSNFSETKQFLETQVIGYGEPVRAVEFIPIYGKDDPAMHFLAVGLESGDVWIYRSPEEMEGWESMGWKYKVVGKFPVEFAPDKAITEIRCRPGSGSEKGWEMAVASEDGSVRIYAFEV
ncbi:WD40-repeat-containing domain protein [Peziza echinospora]|nr:WD40-repeat-containing domain protein [Peziza echinospora]